MANFIDEPQLKKWQLGTNPNLGGCRQTPKSNQVKIVPEFLKTIAPKNGHLVTTSILAEAAELKTDQQNGTFQNIGLSHKMATVV